MRFLLTIFRNIIYLLLTYAVGVAIAIFYFSVFGVEQAWSLVPYIINQYSSGLLFIAAVIAFFFTILSTLHRAIKSPWHQMAHIVFCFAFFIGALWVSFLLQDLSGEQPDIFHSLYATEAKEEYHAVDGQGFWFEQRLSADRVANIVLVNPDGAVVLSSEQEGQFDTSQNRVSAGSQSIAWESIGQLEFAVESRVIAENFFSDSENSFSILSDFFQTNGFLLRVLLLAQIAAVFFSLSLFLLFSTRSFAVHIGLFLCMIRIIVWVFPQWMAFGVSLYPNTLVLLFVFSAMVLLVSSLGALLLRRRQRA